jgi:CysZ protein
MRHFALGFLAPLRGLLLILNHRSLLRLAIAPFILSAVIIIGGFTYCVPSIASLVAFSAHAFLSLIQVSDVTYFGHWLFWFVQLFLWPAATVAMFFILWTVSRWVCSPFFSLLATRVLILRGAVSERRFSVADWSRLSLRMMRVSFFRSLIMLVLGACLFVLSFIPGLAIFTTLIFLFLLAADVSDYGLEALEMGLQGRLNFTKEHWTSFFGLGCAIGLVFLIPGLNFFLLPAAVAGASDVVRRLSIEGKEKHD